MPVANTDWTVGQTSHRLISEALGDELRQAMQAGSSVDPIRYRVSAVLYLLLRDHCIDRRGRCRSCRRPGAMITIRRQPCRILIKARYWLLHPPDQAHLLSQLATELPASPSATQHERSPPADPTPALTSRATTAAFGNTDVLLTLPASPSTEPTRTRPFTLSREGVASL
jgi:hypothetical protein